MSLVPVEVYGLEVPPGGLLVEAAPDFPATFRITMAAIDPSASPRLDAHPDGAAPRATLKLIKERVDFEDDSSDDEDYDDDDDAIEAIKARLGITEDDDEDDESEDSDSDEETNGGPSDPARKRAILKAALKEDIEMEDLEDGKSNGLVNGVKPGKGKAKALDLADLENDSDEESDGEEVEEFVLCTLDPEKHYQQPLDITVGENERVYFKVSGTHTIYLTGNYVIPESSHDHDHDDEDDYDDEEMDYDLSPDEEELEDEDEEDDMLDSLKDPRVTEVDSDEEAPKLIKAAKSKGKNKRPADDSDDEQAVTLDELISKSLKPEAATNGEPQLSKKQLKKLKKNDGQATATAVETPSAKKDEPKKDQNGTPNSAKSDKKVQFAKNLEQGPTGSPLTNGKNGAKKDESPKTGLGPKTIQGVTVDDKKLGKGPAAKKGDKIGMRYIGKLKDGKVFDSNKKGKPFSFKLGVGEVIKGWDIGVVGMAVGGERRITIPSKLAYGSKGMPGIPANSELIFDIKMMSVN